MRKSIILIFILALLLPITVNAENNYLYDVLKNEAESNGLAREYTGEHHDSFTKEPSHKIYHWYASNNTEGNQVLEKNNVIFNDFCWQIIRTTDTGGVKLVYNGLPRDGRCESGYTHSIPFNYYGNSLADVGYMYNTRYINNEKIENWDDVLSSKTLSTNIWYSDNVVWNSSTNKWQLENPSKLLSNSDYANLVGKYTFFSTTQTASNSVVNYVVNASSYSTNYIELSDNNPLSYYNYKYTYGSNYTDNGDGTYKITSPSSFYRTNYQSNYDSLKNRYVCINATNNICSDLIYVTHSTATRFDYLKIADNYKYGNSFTYDNGVYHLSDDNVNIWDAVTYSSINKLRSHHYTCFNLTGECETLSYVHLVGSMGSIYYIELTDGKSIEDAINEMLYDDNVNTNNSAIKQAIDEWFENNLTPNLDKIEDTIYCNDRSMKSLGGWDANNGYIQSSYTFRNDDPSRLYLDCVNDTDKFSVSNNKAKLTYPVGLISAGEMKLLNNSKLRDSDSDNWLMTPNDLNGKTPYSWQIARGGALFTSNISGYDNVRPAISLKSGVRYYSGDGSRDNPYNIDIDYYTVSVEINNETEDLTVEIDDLSKVEEGETVNFNVTPIKGHKVTSIRIVDDDNNEVEYTTTNNKYFTFTMPATNVTIIPSFERVKNAVNVEDNKNTKEFVIEVNDSQAVVYEDTVRFRLDPEEGYEVESIEITDEEQNKINYKKTSNKNEYEFIMPDTDVLIKPYYRLIPSNNGLPNPNTKRQILLIVISVIILSIMTFIYIKKKKRLT